MYQILNRQDFNEGGKMCVGVFNPNVRAALYSKIKTAFKRIHWQPCNYGFVGKLDVE
jgi:hypothetical protein